jgi:hypothetical protein
MIVNRARQLCSGTHKVQEEGGSRVSSGSIVSDYGLDKGLFLYHLCPDRLWGPPGLLYNGYRGSFPRGQSAAGAWHWSLTPHLGPMSGISRSYSSSPPKCLHGVYRDCFTFFTRGRGRPRNSWRRTTLNESGKHSWSDLRCIARSREGWRRFVDNLCS